MSRKYFGTDGIRGKVGKPPMTPEFALKLGWAAGRVLGGAAGTHVLVGKDTRRSGYMFESALEAGFAAAGVETHLLGPLPTPAVAYLTRALRAKAGVVISASHNPHFDNGVKFFSADGDKLSDDIEAQIEAQLEHELVCVPPEQFGRARRIDDAPGRYIEFCKGSFQSRSLHGLKLVLAERHNVPVVELAMLFNAGRAADAGGRSGTASLALDMLDEGAGKLGSLDIARRESELGSSLSAATQRDVSMVGLSTIDGKLPEALDLYATVVTQPTFPEAELARVKQRMLAGIVQEKSDAFGLARRVLSRQLYGEGSPYAYAGAGLESDVKAIGRDDLVAFQQRWMRPDNATLIIAGDTTLARIKPLLEARLGGWKAPAAPLPVKPPVDAPAQAGQRVFLIDKPGAAQSLVLAANLAPPAADPDEEAMGTVNVALGGTFNSRLNMNLREAKHWSYGAGSTLIRARGPQVFLADANVEEPRTADAVREMRRELADLVGAKPLGAAEIESAKQGQLRSLPGDFESVGGVLGGVGHLIEFGLPDDYWNALVPRVLALQPPQLQAAAQKLIKPDQLTWVVVGDLSKIEAPVRALKLGEVKVLDGDGRMLR